MFTTTDGREPEHAGLQHPRGMRSVEPMRSFRPSCVLIGVVMPPFELLALLIRRFFVSGARAPDSSRI